MDRRQFLIATGAASLSLVAGCAESDTSDREQGDANGDSDNTAETGDADSQPGDDSESDTYVEVLDHEFYTEQYSAGVRGTLENVSGEELSYVEVSVYFLDAQDTQIAEGLANTSDLAAGRRWEFDAMFLGDDPSRVDTYEVQTEVTNY